VNSLREIGTVKSLNKEYAKISMQRSAACEGCKACRMGMEENEMEIDVLNLCDANIGDRVEINLDSPDVLRAAMIVYAIPLFGFLLSIYISYTALVKMNFNTGVEVISFLISAFVMFIIFTIIKSKDKEFKDSKKYTPTITKIVEKNKRV
jgi:sigma-E factor negative regulatory protein RseC